MITQGYGIDDTPVLQGMRSPISRRKAQGQYDIPFEMLMRARITVRNLKDDIDFQDVENV